MDNWLKQLGITLCCLSLFGCNISDTGIAPCKEGAEKNGQVCQNGRWVTRTVQDMPLDLGADLQDMPSASDMMDMSGDRSDAADMPDISDMLSDQPDIDEMTECQPATVCNVAGVSSCGSIEVEGCGLIDCGQCGADEVCNTSSQCECPEIVCDNICGMQTNACGASKDCGQTCSFGRACTVGACADAEQILPSKPLMDSGFGWSIATDGEWLAIGSPTQSVNGRPNVGVVDVYRYQNQTWQHVKHLSPNTKENRFIGFSLAIKDNVLIVGAPGDMNTEGRVYVYQNALTTWQLVDTINGNDGDMFGWSVDLWSEGSAFGQIKVLIGAPEKRFGELNLYDCRRVTGGCNRNENIDSNSPNGRLGFAVSSDPDNNRHAVGNPGFSMSFPRAGRVTIVGDELKVLKSYDAPTPAAEQHFGASVRLSMGSLVVGAPGERKGALNDVGRAYFFPLDLGITIPLDTLSPAKDGRFGASISNTLNQVIVGAPGEGNAYVFTFDPSGNYTTQSLPVPAGATLAAFGQSVSWSKTSNQIFVGAPSAGEGAVYLFDL